MDYTQNIPVFHEHPVKYSSNTEFRKVFRQITDMDVSKYHENIHNLPNIDEETLDEYNFDEASASAFMDKVEAATSHEQLFIQLYELAAAKMISTNIQIGIAVLCSYDYLHLFYPLLCEYTNSPQTFTQNNEYYVKLMKKII